MGIVVDGGVEIPEEGNRLNKLQGGLKGNALS